MDQSIAKISFMPSNINMPYDVLKQCLCSKKELIENGFDRENYHLKTSNGSFLVSHKMLDNDLLTFSFQYRIQGLIRYMGCDQMAFYAKVRHGKLSIVLRSENEEPTVIIRNFNFGFRGEISYEMIEYYRDVILDIVSGYCKLNM